MVSNGRSLQQYNRNLQNIDPHTGEVLDQQIVVDGSRKVVDQDYRRELKQFKGFGEGVNDQMSAQDVFNNIKQDIAKVVEYDGLPTVALADYVGRCIRVVGSVFRSVHSFRSKEVLDETGQGMLVEGYDKLVLRVAEITNNKMEWVEARDSDGNDLLMATSAQQPCNLFEAAHARGIAPGDFPDGCSMDFRIRKMGNAILIGPAEV